MAYISAPRPPSMTTFRTTEKLLAKKRNGEEESNSRSDYKRGSDLLNRVIIKSMGRVMGFQIYYVLYRMGIPRAVIKLYDGARF